MFERDRLKRVAIVNNLEAPWSVFKSARNNVNATSREQKPTVANDTSGDVEKSWKGVNSILGRIYLQAK